MYVLCVSSSHLIASHRISSHRTEWKISPGKGGGGNIIAFLHVRWSSRDMFIAVQVCRLTYPNVGFFFPHQWCMGVPVRYPDTCLKIKNKTNHVNITWFVFLAPERSLGAPRPQPQPASHPVPLAPPPTETSTAQHPSTPPPPPPPRLTIAALPLISNQKSLAKKDYFLSQPRGNAPSLACLCLCLCHALLKHTLVSSRLVSSHHITNFFSR